MKTAGIILILFSGTGLGLCKSMELTARLKILEKLAQLLLLLKGEIRCTGATLEDAFLDAAAKMPGEYRLFLKETAGWLQQRPGITFDEIFRGMRECAVRLLPFTNFQRKSGKAFWRRSFLWVKNWDIWTFWGNGSCGTDTSDTSGGGARLQDKDSEKCYAKAAKNISEHGNQMGGILLAVLLW